MVKFFGHSVRGKSVNFTLFPLILSFDGVSPGAINQYLFLSLLYYNTGASKSSMFKLTSFMNRFMGFVMFFYFATIFIST